MGVARNFGWAYLGNPCELKPKILHVSVFQVDVLRKKIWAKSEMVTMEDFQILVEFIWNEGVEWKSDFVSKTC